MCTGKSNADAPRLSNETIHAIGYWAKAAGVAILLFIMLICYLILIFYFKSRGDYLVVDLEHCGDDDGEGRA